MRVPYMFVLVMSVDGLSCCCADCSGDVHVRLPSCALVKRGTCGTGAKQTTRGSRPRQWSLGGFGTCGGPMASIDSWRLSGTGSLAGAGVTSWLRGMLSRNDDKSKACETRSDAVKSSKMQASVREKAARTCTCIEIY